MSQPPWTSGPSEILQHGLSLLEKDSDKNRRLSMLSIDNAVELIIKTFLGLPSRISGIKIPRKEYQEISESFPLLLDALEKHAPDKLIGVDLGEIEWFHRLRNQLYHQGNGLTVDKDKVEIYGELAKLLYRNLFGLEIKVSQKNTHEILGEFIVVWSEIEHSISDLVETNEEKLSKIKTTEDGLPLPAWMKRNYGIRELYRVGIINKELFEKITVLQKNRNALIHGNESIQNAFSGPVLSNAKLVLEELNKIKGVLP